MATDAEYCESTSQDTHLIKPKHLNSALDPLCISYTTDPSLPYPNAITMLFQINSQIPDASEKKGSRHNSRHAGRFKIPIPSPNPCLKSKCP